MTLLIYAVCFLSALAALRYLFPYGYLLRVPLICGAIFVSFPYLATTGPLRAFGNGMFEVKRWDIWQIAFAVFTTAAALLTTTDLVVSHGADRTPGTPHLPHFWGTEIVKRPIRLSVLSCLLGAVYFAGAVYYLVSLKPIEGWGGQAALELAIGLLIFLLSVGLLWLLTRSGKPQSALTGAFRTMASRDGYIDPATGRVYAGHAVAAILCAFSILAFLAFGIVRYIAIAKNTTIGVAAAETPTVPTLAWVVLLVLVYCWLFSGIAFWLDAIRIPVLLPIAILLGLCGYFFPASDHVYPVITEGAFTPASPRELLDAVTPKADPNAIIVVAASGGGIQAAAWTATVVEGLTKAIPRFAPNVRLMSGVSGGSVGLMYFAAAYENGDIPHTQLSARVLENVAGGNPLFRLASAASLDYAAWGLAFPDFFRSWIPFKFYQDIDRAWALSRAWVRYQGMERLATATLGGWANDARVGARPAVVFNATLAETGARYLLSTFRLDKPLHGRRHFLADLPKHDILAATAARLSAAFPYVSPASRADASCGGSPCGHIVDGGYYDNYGIASSVEFLLEALPDARGKRVLLIQIEAGRFGEKAVGRTQRGWFYQVLAPPVGLLNVWDTGMRSRNEVEIALLNEAIAHRGGHFERVRVDFPGAETPTSWYLTREEKNRITSAWRNDRGPKTVPAVRNFLHPRAP